MTIRAFVSWGLIGALSVLPLWLAAQSPYLAYRDAVYIASGFAGIAALVLTLWQPVLAAGVLPGLSARRARQVHRWSGLLLLLTVILHVVGLWITSPPDVVDALTFTSPTPFSIWGVLAMWSVFATAILALSRRRLKLSHKVWRLGHPGLAVVIAGGGVAHALLIEGTMETASKLALSGLVLLATLKVVLDFRLWWQRRG